LFVAAEASSKICLGLGWQVLWLDEAVSALEDKVSALVAQVMHLKECDSYLVEIIESACEQLKCEFSIGPLEFPAASLGFVF
jgi:hypothetical protein